jgi:hypothetical protein
MFHYLCESFLRAIAPRVTKPTPKINKFMGSETVCILGFDSGFEIVLVLMAEIFSIYDEF